MYEKEKELVPQILRASYEQVILPACESNAALGVYSKGERDLVTECDYNSEAFIKAEISRIFPEDQFVSEEKFNIAIPNGRAWVLDPVDGTVNFAHGVEIYGIQIALLVDREPVFSCIFRPLQNEMYVASLGEGLYLNGKRVFASKTKSLSDAVVTFGDYSNSAPDMRETQKSVMLALAESVMRVRMLGSSCTDFAFLGKGVTDIHIMYCRTPWDIYPGGFAAREAGAVLNFDFSKLDHFVLCAANQGLFDEAFALLDPINRRKDV